MTKKIILDEFEQDLENNFEHCLPVPDMEQQMGMLRKAASEHLKKRKSITLRVSEMDLEAIKIKASKIGVAYQTYINMILHKEATTGF